jgi:hypothetical protein
VRFKESQKNSGVEFGLVYKPGSNTDILVMFVTSFLVQRTKNQRQLSFQRYFVRHQVGAQSLLTRSFTVTLCDFVRHQLQPLTSSHG